MNKYMNLSYLCLLYMVIGINNNSVKHRRNICNEVNRRDTVGDIIKYQISLRNYYKRLYDGTTYQLGRNLQLLWFYYLSTFLSWAKKYDK